MATEDTDAAGGGADVTVGGLLGAGLSNAMEKGMSVVAAAVVGRKSAAVPVGPADDANPPALLLLRKRGLLHISQFATPGLFRNVHSRQDQEVADMVNRMIEAGEEMGGEASKGGVSLWVVWFFCSCCVFWVLGLEKIAFLLAQDRFFDRHERTRDCILDRVPSIRVVFSQTNERQITSTLAS